MTDRNEPTWENQLWHARKLLAEKGLEALDNPHAMIGRQCGCGTCFTCAAAFIVDQERALEQEIAEALDRVGKAKIQP